MSDLLHCGLASRCPGCPAIELDVGAQLAAKRARVGQALARFEATRTLEVAPCPAIGARDHYRTRTKWVVDGEGRIGLYARGTHDVVDLEACPVLRPSIGRVVAALRELRACTPVLASRGLRGVDLRETLGGTASEPACVLVSLTYGRGAVPGRVELDALERALLDTVSADGGARSASRSRSRSTTARRARSAPTASIARALASIASARARPSSRRTARSCRPTATWRLRFMIASPRASLRCHASRMADAVGSSSSSRARARSAAPRERGCRRHRRRALPSAIELARASAERAGIDDRFRAVALDAAEALVPESGLDAVIVNPPRRGVSPSVRDALARAAPSLLVYVACDPETLARDPRRTSGVSVCALARPSPST
ncbi:MAG: hypothetical protein IPN34_27640 [Planctomycetes bacterium]|nr:hypothetical protein [Planctomycetota bacterium]